METQYMVLGLGYIDQESDLEEGQTTKDLEIGMSIQHVTTDKYEAIRRFKKDSCRSKYLIEIVKQEEDHTYLTLEDVKCIQMNHRIMNTRNL